MEGSRHLSIFRNEVPVIVGESQIAVHISHSDSFWPAHNCSCLAGIHFYTPTGDYMAQVGDFSLKELTFTRLQFEPCSGQFCKHCSHFLDVLLWCLGKDYYII